MIEAYVVEIGEDRVLLARVNMAPTALDGRHKYTIVSDKEKRECFYITGGNCFFVRKSDRSSFEGRSRRTMVGYTMPRGEFCVPMSYGPPRQDYDFSKKKA